MQLQEGHSRRAEVPSFAVHTADGLSFARDRASPPSLLASLVATEACVCLVDQLYLRAPHLVHSPPFFPPSPAPNFTPSPSPSPPLFFSSPSPRPPQIFLDHSLPSPCPRLPLPLPLPCSSPRPLFSSPAHPSFSTLSTPSLSPPLPSSPLPSPSSLHANTCCIDRASDATVDSSRHPGTT